MTLVSNGEPVAKCCLVPKGPSRPTHTRPNTEQELQMNVARGWCCGAQEVGSGAGAYQATVAVHGHEIFKRGGQGMSAPQQQGHHQDGDARHLKKNVGRRGPGYQGTIPVPTLPYPILIGHRGTTPSFGPPSALCTGPQPRIWTPGSQLPCKGQAGLGGSVTGVIGTAPGWIRRVP